MDKIQVPKDDLLDIMELSKNLQEEISKILENQEMNIALSSLTKALASIMITQAENKYELQNINSICKKLLDLAIEHACKYWDDDEV